MYMARRIKRPVPSPTFPFKIEFDRIVTGILPMLTFTCLLCLPCLRLVLSCLSSIIDRGDGYEDPEPFVDVVAASSRARIHLFVGSQRAKGGVMVMT